jgi:hypothetical protein
MFDPFLEEIASHYIDVATLLDMLASLFHLDVYLKVHANAYFFLQLS